MFDPGRLFGRGWIPHGSPLWPSLATADPAKVTKYIFLVSCASANERSIQIKGDAKVLEASRGEMQPDPARKWQFWGVLEWFSRTLRRRPRGAQ